MKLIEQINSRKADKIPPGWLTIEQLATAEGYSSSDSVSAVAREAVKLRLLERRFFRAPNGRGLSRVAHYRYTKPAKG